MKILVGRSSCEIIFNDTENMFSHKTLLIFGEGNSNNEFCVHRPLKMCWVLEAKDEKSKEKCVWVDEKDKEDLLSYVIKESKKTGCSLLLSQWVFIMYFNIDAHKDCFKTNENEACFWHGQTNGIGGQDNAMSIANENNGQTLEMCMLDNRDELEKAGVKFRDLPDGTVDISYGSNQDERSRFWEDCSKAFAEQASGDARVIDGKDIRPNGQAESDYPCVYNRIEHPALENNDNVNNIIHIDPESRKTTAVESAQNSNQVNGTLPGEEPAEKFDPLKSIDPNYNDKDYADNLSNVAKKGADAVNPNDFSM